MNTVKIEISARTILLLLAFVVGIWTIYQSRELILLLFASLVIASALYPTVDWLNKRMPRGLAVTLIYLLGFIILATVLIPFFITLSQQFDDFLRLVPNYADKTERFISEFQLDRRIALLLPNLDQILSNTVSIGQKIVANSINITINFFVGILAALTLATIVLLLLLDKKELKRGYLSLFPPDIRDQWELISADICTRIGGYIRGELLIMLITGLIATGGLLGIGVDFALLLGLLTGLLEVIPVAGPFTAGTISTIVALAHGPAAAAWTIALYLVLQTAQNRILTPIIFGKFLDVHPLIIIIALLISVKTLGVTGVILSPAIAAAVYVLVQELYVKRINAQQ